MAVEPIEFVETAQPRPYPNASRGGATLGDVSNEARPPLREANLYYSFLL